MSKKFDSVWTEERIKDLLLTHKGRNHTDTALELTRKWGVVVTRNSVKNKYNSLIDFDETAREIVENAEPLKNREFFDKEHSDERKGGKRVYFVTAAIAACELDKKFLASIETFCKARKAKLVVLPMKAIGAKDVEYTDDVLEQLSDHFHTNYVFNRTLEALDLGLSPTQINPLTGLQRVTKKSSVIIASPKQDMEIIPVSNVTIPHMIHSTGAVTKPSYLPNRIGQLALEDHVTGGLVVEVESKDIFHVRQVQADNKGEFYDLGKKYTPKGVKKNKAEVLVLGDIHCGWQDESAMNSWYEVMTELRPKYVFLHDLADNRSISHWVENNISEMSNRANSFGYYKGGIFKTLKSELDNIGSFLVKISNKFPKIKFIVVKSNHDEHLERYLDEGRFIKDAVNYRLALELAIHRCDGLDPLKKYITDNFPSVKRNVIWLKRDQDFKVAGIQLAVHGDVGSNGARGSITGLERSYGNSVTGHSHSPRILRGAWKVGTSTVFDMPYTGGSSSWLHTSCLVYDNSQRQLITSIEGHWRN